jgi:hypothetical protein
MFLVLISVKLPKIFQNTMLDILLLVNGVHLRATYYGPGQDFTRMHNMCDIGTLIALRSAVRDQL